MSEFNEVSISGGTVNRDSLIAGFIRDSENMKYNREDDTGAICLRCSNSNHDTSIKLSGEIEVTNTTQDLSHD